MKLKQLLTDDEIKEVAAQLRALGKEARKRRIPVTKEQKLSMWQMLISKKIASKKHNK